MLRIIVFAVVLVSPAWCGCKEDINKNATYLGCVTSIGGLVQKAMGQGDQKDPIELSKKIMGAMCSPEGRKDFKCMMDFYGRCPEMMTGGGMNMFGPGMNMTQMMQQGGLDAACALMTGPCSKIMDCIKTVVGMDEDPFKGVDPNTIGGTPYSQFQVVSSAICGPMHKFMSCVVEKMSAPACASVIKLVEKQLMPMMQQMESKGLKIHTLNETRDFTMDLCPAMPQGFATNDCVKKSLKSAEFTKCYGDVTQKYDLSKKQDCKVYFDSKKCIETHLIKCGKYAAAFTAGGTPYVMNNVPKTCEKIAPISSAGTLYPSLLAMLLVLAAQMFGRQ